MRISDWSSDVCSSDLLDLETLGVEHARLGRATGGEIEDAVAFPDLEGGRGDQRVRRRLPLHARFVLRAGLRPIGVAEAAVAIVDPAGDRQEALDRKSTRLNSSH